MLVLTRRSGESVRIGAEVRITVISTSGGQVRLGIEGAQAVPVHREEIYERIAQANREASQVPDDALASLARGRAGGREGSES